MAPSVVCFHFVWDVFWSVVKLILILYSKTLTLSRSITVLAHLNSDPISINLTSTFNRHCRLSGIFVGLYLSCRWYSITSQNVRRRNEVTKIWIQWRKRHCGEAHHGTSDHQIFFSSHVAISLSSLRGFFTRVFGMSIVEWPSLNCHYDVKLFVYTILARAEHSWQP